MLSRCGTVVRSKATAVRPVTSGNVLLREIVILHYQDPENFMAPVLFDSGGTVTPALVRYQDGKKMEILAASSTFGLTDNTAYTVLCDIHDDPGTAALQELVVKVGGTVTERVETGQR